MFLSENIKYLRKKAKISQQQLADTLGIPRTTLGDYERGKTEPNLSKLVEISKQFDVNLDDLIRSDLSLVELEVLKNRDLRVLAISVDEHNEGLIDLVDSKVEAGYLDSYQDPEYIKELPKFRFPSIPEGTYRAFEIIGNSMLPLESGSIVIASYVEKIDYIKDDHTYVIISHSDGLVYKRTYRDSGNQLILVSDNAEFSPYTIDYSDIQEIWQYYAHISFSDARDLQKQSIEYRLSEIQKLVNKRHQNQ